MEDLNIEILLEKIRDYNPEEEKIIKEAYLFAEKHHNVMLMKSSFPPN